MAVQSHIHNWSQAFGGLQCTDCSAFISHAVLQANVNNTHHAAIDFNTLVNQAWKKSGGT